MHVQEHMGQRPGDLNGLVAAAVVDHDDEIDDTLCHDLFVSAPNRPRRVVRGHDHDYPLTLEHSHLPVQPPRPVPEGPHVRRGCGG